MSSELAFNTLVSHGGRWKRYPAYKDSGVEWIGEVPEGWLFTRLKYTLKEKLKYGANESAELDDTNLPRYIRITDFGDDGKLKDDTFKSLPFEVAKDYILQLGDVLFARSGATVGKTFQFKNYDGLACFAGYLIKATPNENIILSDYLYFLTKSNMYDNWKNNTFIQATIQNIGADKYSSLPMLLPNIDEQRAIAAFLDRETGCIDTLIEKKERQIELLQEKRAALISHAVTKGLDPDVKMKDSGVEWLGDVPEEWDVDRLRFHIIINPTKSEVQGLAPDTTVSFVPMESVGEYGGLCLDQTKQIEGVIAGYTYFSDGDVVVAKITPCFENGKGAIIKGLKNGIGFGTTELHVLRPGNNIDYHFLFYLTISYTFRKLGEAEMYGAAGQKRVPENFIKNLKHPIPTFEEQRAIAAFLERETGRIDILTTKIRESISKLREYRTALISAAVTGKIDVREGV